MSDKPEANTWKLNIGIHRGSVMSRSIETKTLKYDAPHEFLKSLEDCINTAREWASNYQKMGYQVYIADAIAPDGTIHENIILTAFAPTK